MRKLNGQELADYIKERQAHQARVLRQAHGIVPKLAIVQTKDDPVIDKYVSLKHFYGHEVGVEVELHKISQSQALNVITTLNNDPSVHGIIVQLPLENSEETEVLVNQVAPQKDVDGLGKDSMWDPATPTAINWLLAGYNIELRNKKIAIVGRGRLIGSPLAKMWTSSGLNVQTFDKSDGDISAAIKNADIVVTATGVPGLITSEMIAPDTVVVDAGTASEHKKLVGDISKEVRQREDITVTPAYGGVGPLTVTAIFDNVLRSVQAQIK